MEYLYNSTTRKYTELLGGVLYDNCTRDSDCPGQAVCGVNQTWSAVPNMCICRSAYGVTGSLCEDISPVGWFLYVGMIISATIAFAGVPLGVLGVYRLVILKKFRRDALSTSLAFGTIACFWTGVQCAAMTRHIVEIIPPNPETGSKEDTDPVGEYALGLSFFFSTLAMLNISLIWIAISQDVERLRARSIANIDRYRGFLIAYYFIFFAVIVYASVVQNLVIAGYAAIPGVIFVVFTYVIGFYQMKKTLMTSVSSELVKSGLGGTRVNAEGIRKLQQSLKSIANTALGVGLTAIGFMICVGIWAITGGLTQRPDRELNIIALTLLWLCAAIVNLVIIWYLHITVLRKKKALAGDVMSRKRVPDERISVLVTAHQVADGPAPSDEFRA